MPFTFSHPAAVLPVAGKRLPLSALVVGSMSPDFIYFIYLSPHGAFMHTIAGVFQFCLPAGLLALWLYHRLIKDPIRALLAGTERKPPAGSGEVFRFLPLKGLFFLSLAIVIGAFTHLIWDGFTHEKGWALQYLPFLKVTVLDLGFDRIPLTRVLHHLSSIAGALIIGICVRRHARRARDRRPAKSFRRIIYIALWLLGSLLLGYLYAWGHAHPVHSYPALRRMMVQGVVASGSAFFSIAFFYSLIWHFAVRKRAPQIDFRSGPPFDRGR